METAAPRQVPNKPSETKTTHHLNRYHRNPIRSGKSPYSGSLDRGPTECGGQWKIMQLGRFRDKSHNTFSTRAEMTGRKMRVREIK